MVLVHESASTTQKEHRMPKLFTVKEVAEHFHKRPKTIWRWIAAGMFPNAKKVKDGWYIPEPDVEKAFTRK